MNTTPIQGRILIADDEPQLRTMLCDWLEREGYETEGYASGAKALEALKERDFDLLLTDLMMPEMDGIELLKAGLEADPNLIGILITGEGAVDTAVEAMKIGAFDYVLKPLNLNAVRPIIARALQVRHLRLEKAQLRETVAIHELSEAIASTLDFSTILNRVADAALQQTEADEASIMLPTREGDELYVAVARGGDRSRLVGERVPMRQGVAGWVACHGEAVLLQGSVKDSRFSPRHPRPDILCAIAMPMLVGGKFVGVLNLNRTRVRRSFTQGQMKALNILIGLAGPALENAWLHEQVQQAEEKYRSIFENAMEGIYQATLEGRFITANPALARILGYASPEELTNEVTDTRAQFAADRERYPQFMQAMAEHGFIKDFEAEVQRKDGSIIWISTNTHPVVDADGNVICFEGTVADITERKLAEETLKETNVRLEAALADLEQTQQAIVQHERLQALGTMASGIAHDFNNALSPLLGYSDLMLCRPEILNNPQQVKEYVEIIATGARDASHVVSRLREFYRHREATEVFFPADLNGLVQQSISITQPKWKDQAQADGRSITIETDLGEVPLVAGNESELREVLTNLIFNAVDAMPNGGTLTLRTTMEEVSGAQVSNIKSPEYVTLSVSDTGTGMTEEVRQHCLDPFFTTKEDKGTGLGLSMVFGIIQRHEGTIDIKSEWGQGTTFILRLPVWKKLSHDVVSHDPIGHKREEVVPLHILLVDDDSKVRAVAVAILASLGHTVETAASGREGLEMFHRGRYDLVVTDRAMPEMNGDELAQTVKQVAPKKPVIMLTGFGEFMTATGERPAGVDLVVAKPITLTTLQEAVEKVMSAARESR